MNHSIKTWAILAAICIAPALLMVAFGPSISYSSLDFFGRLSGLIGLSLLSLSIIISARIKLFDRLFHGLDKMYRIHHQLAGWTVILLLVHFILITLYYAQISLVSGYRFLLDFSLPLLAAKFGLVILVCGVLFLYYTWVNYQWFVKVMRILGAVIFLAGYHALLTPGSNVRTILPLFIYMSVLGGFAAGLYIYRSLFHRNLHRLYCYRVKSVNNLGNITEVWLKPDQSRMQYYSGQFAFVTFNDNILPNETHPFSISSGSDNTDIRFCIKNSGDFTSKLGQLRTGGLATIDGPYGAFSFTKIRNKKQVWVAGGIGITPFLSMAQVLPSNVQVDLFWSVTSLGDAPFIKELEAIQKQSQNFKLHVTVTGEASRITAQTINLSANTANADILLCGPAQMMKSLAQQFKQLGVSDNKIHYEEFAL